MNLRTVVAAWLLCTGTISADTPGEALVLTEGAEYRKTRNELVADGRSVAEMREALATTAYRADNWLGLVLTEAAVMRATGHGDVRRLRNLEGLDPAHYLLRRRPEPNVARELDRTRDSAPLMMELLLKELDGYRWSSVDAAPMERRALVRGLLLAIGRSGHPASVFLLAHVAAEGCASSTSCEPVIRALGDTGSAAAVPVLVKLAAEAREENHVDRVATVLLAMGRIRRDEVWPHIEAGLAHPAAIVRTAAARAAGAMGSSRYWRRAVASGEVIQEAVGAALVEVLVTEEDDGVAGAALASIGRVATPALRAHVQREMPYAGHGSNSHGAPNRVSERMYNALNALNRVLGPKS